MHLWRLYIVVKFQTPSYITFWDMNYCPVRSGQTTDRRQTDNRQTESNTYEPTVQNAQVGSKMQLDVDVSPSANIMTFKPGLAQLTFDLDQRDLWPWPMTLNTTPWNYCVVLTLVTPDYDYKTNMRPEIVPFDLVTLTFDLRRCPLRSWLGSSMCMLWHQCACFFIVLSATLCEIWIIVQSDFLSSDRQTTRQTDRKWCIRAHRALAQVGSKIASKVGKNNRKCARKNWEVVEEKSILGI